MSALRAPTATLIALALVVPGCFTAGLHQGRVEAADAGRAAVQPGSDATPADSGASVEDPAASTSQDAADDTGAVDDGGSAAIVQEMRREAQQRLQQERMQRLVDQQRQAQQRLTDSYNDQVPQGYVPNDSFGY